jgi:hypothetical protein
MLYLIVATIIAALSWYLGYRSGVRRTMVATKWICTWLMSHGVPQSLCRRAIDAWRLNR